jgi:hypothetical protein
VSARKLCTELWTRLWTGTASLALAAVVWTPPVLVVTSGVLPRPWPLVVAVLLVVVEANVIGWWLSRPAFAPLDDDFGDDDMPYGAARGA